MTGDPMTKILITGARGFIAGQLARVLGTAGMKLIGTSRTGGQVSGFDRVYETQLADLDSALETNRKILALDDVNEQAIAALERLYQASEDWPNLLEVFQKKVDLAADDEERKEIHFRVARLYEEQIGGSIRRRRRSSGENGWHMRDAILH